MKFELDWCRTHPNVHFANIAVLTGLSFSEIRAAAPDKIYWGGQDFVRTFQKLGFNTNNRFIKFDKDTEYPCLLRIRRTDVLEAHWYVFPYYDGSVGYSGERVDFPDWEMMLRCYGVYRITSMLQVWI